MNNDLTNLIYKTNSNLKNNYYDSFKNKKLPKSYFISIIIPVRGRVQFLKPLINSFKASIRRTQKKINITIVEHSNESSFKSECKELSLNYYWIKSEPDEHFNKSLCHNVGAIINKNSKYYLFHDLDCLVYDDFIETLVNGIEHKNISVTQSFKGRRVLYLDEYTTNRVISGLLPIIDIDITTLVKSESGAPGGSILIDKNLFYDVGGFDPELFFGYSPEDSFMWSKIEHLKPILSADNEVLHMWHERLDKTNNVLSEMTETLRQFNDLSKEDKRFFIDFKKNILINYSIL